MARADDVIIVGDGRGVRRVRLGDYLDAGRAERAEREANAWVKSLRGVQVGGLPFRERFTHRGDSLWWFAELYLHKMQVANRVFRTLLALDALVERERPAQLGASAADPYVRVLARRVAERDGLAWIGGGRGLAPSWVEHLRIAARAHLYIAASAWSRATRPAEPPRRPAAVAAFVHAAFWRGHEEQYIGPVLRELEAALPAGDVALVGLGPETSYKARAWHHRVSGRRRRGHAPRLMADAFASAAQLAPSRGVWRRRRDIFAAMTGSPELRRAAVIRGCDAWPLVEPALMGVAYLQFPWSAQVMDQLGAALDAIAPSAVVTYAEAGAWGRALVLEARRRGIASAGLQHGFIYRHWLNYLHEPDEMAPAAGNAADRGFPVPSRTLVYDDFAAAHLRSAGRFPPSALAVTGSARLDTLVRRAGLVTVDDMERTRRAVGAGESHSVVVVAAKYAQIAQVFPQLVRESGGIPGVRLVVKPHPAETAAPYLAAAQGAAHVAIAPAGVDLADLTRIARLLVTVNSTAAIEAMVMGVPSLVLAMPNNLTPLVEAGAMSGVNEGEPIGPALRALLADERGRAELLLKSAAFMARYRVGSDGGAARRAAEEIVRLASGTDQPAKVF
ncbi:MAG: hypothetical protein ACM3H9_03145 [Rhodospirillaceae bacterium]